MFAGRLLSFAGACITLEADGWRWVHVTLGYTVAGFVLFRLLWGLIGTRYARFAGFVHGPEVVARHVRDLVEGRPERHLVHNPAGAVAIVALASWQQRENLVRAMVNGRKSGRPDEGIQRAWRPLVALLLLVVLGFWGWRWQTAPAAGAGPAAHGDAAEEEDD